MIYTQCPICAGVALRVRTTQPVVMVAHLNISQADEWADKGEIPRTAPCSGRSGTSSRACSAELDGIVYVSGFNKAELEERHPGAADRAERRRTEPGAGQHRNGERPEPWRI